MSGILYIVIVVIIIVLVILRSKKKQNKIKDEVARPFPPEWREILQKRVRYYKNLPQEDKEVFEKRILLFLATKRIEGVDTEIDDTIRLMVASSAIIPVFAFPKFNYPKIDQVLIYPNSFDEKFQTERYKDHKQFIIGMVGDGVMSGTVALSKPDLIDAYDGVRHKKNVGIHEFVHLIDKQDGTIDGVPKLLLENSYVGTWLHEIRSEMHRIEKRKSDINPYALTSDAEFLAVVSEYFFGNPVKFKKRHPELYQYLETIFHQESAK